MKKGLFIGLLLSVAASPTLACEYYAWVSYGPAKKNGDLKKTEDVYQSSGVMSLEHGFKAVYSEMGETHGAGGFRIENLGPFQNEAVAGKALSDFLDELEGRGYEEAGPRHTLPDLIEKNKVSCQ